MARSTSERPRQESGKINTEASRTGGQEDSEMAQQADETPPELADLSPEDENVEDDREARTDGGKPTGRIMQSADQFQTVFASVVDRFGTESVKDRTDGSFDVSATRTLDASTYTIQVAFDSAAEAAHAREEFESLGYVVFGKPDGRFKDGVDSSTLLLVPTVNATPVPEDGKHASGENVPEFLAEVDADEYLNVTVDGEDGTEDLTVYVVDNATHRAERDQYGPIAGELDLSLEVLENSWDCLDLPSQTADIRARERKPDEWDDPQLAVWAPYKEDGEVVEDWDELGTVVAVSKTEQDSDDPTGDEDGDDPEDQTDGGTPELPSEEAFDADGFRVTTADEEEFELLSVGSDRIEENAYVKGRQGGRRQHVTLEGEYDGPAGEGVYVFHATITEEKGSDRAEVSISLAETFTESGEEEPLDVASVEGIEHEDDDTDPETRTDGGQPAEERDPEALAPEDLPEGMTRWMVTFRDLAAPDTFVVAHSRGVAKQLAEDEQGEPPHAARDPESKIVDWDPDGVPEDQWIISDTTPEAVIDGFVHDPVNSSESLQVLLGELREALPEECPDCGREITGLRASMEDVFDYGRVYVKHGRGQCAQVPVAVNWTSQEGEHAPEQEDAA